METAGCWRSGLISRRPRVPPCLVPSHPIPWLLLMSPLQYFCKLKRIMTDWIGSRGFAPLKLRPSKNSGPPSRKQEDLNRPSAFNSPPVLLRIYCPSPQGWCCSSIPFLSLCDCSPWPRLAFWTLASTWPLSAMSRFQERTRYCNAAALCIFCIVSSFNRIPYQISFGSQALLMVPRSAQDCRKRKWSVLLPASFAFFTSKLHSCYLHRQGHRIEITLHTPSVHQGKPIDSTISHKCFFFFNNIKNHSGFKWAICRTSSNYNAMFSGKSLRCDMCADASWHKPSASTHLQVNRSGQRRFLPKPVRKWKEPFAAVLSFSPQCSRWRFSAKILHLGEFPSPDKPCIVTFSSFSFSSAEFNLPTSEKLFLCVIFQNALQDSRLEPLTIQFPWRVTKVIKAVKVAGFNSRLLSLKVK